MAGFTTAAQTSNLLTTFAPNPVTSRGQGVHLNIHPKEPRILYGSGKSVVIRNLANPLDVFTYRGHNAAVTVAKFSPNGFWVASGDAHGKIRIWSWDNPEHILKLEVQAFVGEVKDLDWDPENSKITAVGDGGSGGVVAKAFNKDTGSSVGEMIGHQKRCLSVTYRPCRPFRIMTASEDMKTIFYAGPPFRLDHSNSTHTNFVNCVRYSPNGQHIVSVGSDKKIQLYDGATGMPTTEIANDHAGSIYAVAWSNDSSMIATASADKTVKVFSIAEGGSLIATHTPGGKGAEAQVGDFQVGVAWSKDFLVSLSLNGDINYLNSADPSAPAKVLRGHQGPITSLLVDRSPSAGEEAASSPSTASSSSSSSALPSLPRIFSSSSDGTVCAWQPSSSGLVTKVKGPDSRRAINNALHGGKVTSLASASTTAGDATLLSLGWDDAARLTPLSTTDLTSSAHVGLSSQPVAVSPCGPGLSVVATLASLALVSVPSMTVVTELSLASLGGAGAGSFTPTSLAVSSSTLSNGDQLVALGRSDNKISLFTVSSASQDASATITALPTPIEGHRGAITTMAFSPCGNMLAAGDANREVRVWRATIHLSAITDASTMLTFESKVPAGSWVYHTTRITSLSWSPNNYQLVTTSIDEQAIVWSLEMPRDGHKTINFTHKEGATAVAFVDASTFITGGNDGCLNVWRVPS